MAWGQDPWAQRDVVLLYEADGYMLNAQEAGDMQGVLDHKMSSLNF